jgi:hypothetical protein
MKMKMSIFGGADQTGSKLDLFLINQSHLPPAETPHGRVVVTP